MGRVFTPGDPPPTPWPGTIRDISIFRQETEALRSGGASARLRSGLWAGLGRNLGPRCPGLEVLMQRRQAGAVRTEAEALVLPRLTRPGSKEVRAPSAA